MKKVEKKKRLRAHSRVQRDNKEKNLNKNEAYQVKT